MEFMSSGGYHPNLPEQHTRRGRSRNARPLPILPPFRDTYDEDEVVYNKTKNLQWKKPGDEVSVDEESRHDEQQHDKSIKEGVFIDEDSNGTRMHCDTVLRSDITSWKESKSGQIGGNSLGDAQHPDIDTIPSDEKPFFERKIRYTIGVSNDADRSIRDQYHLNRLQARVHQRKVLPCSYAEEMKPDLKHLRASRIKVVRGLYQSSKEDFGEDESLVTTEASDVSVRDLTTLSSYRGKCFDKMIYLLNDVAPLEKTDFPCSLNDEGTSLSSNAGGNFSVAELKLIKKAIPSKTIEGAIDEIGVGNQRGILPEVIHRPVADTITSKLSDVTSPTLHDGFELDEVPHFPRIHTARKNNVSSAVSTPQSDHLPSLAEVSESSDDFLVSDGEAKEAQHKTVFNSQDQEEDIPLKSVEKSIEMKPAVKRVTFFETSKTKEIPQTHCCIIM